MKIINVELQENHKPYLHILSESEPKNAKGHFKISIKNYSLKNIINKQTINKFSLTTTCRNSMMILYYRYAVKLEHTR